MSRLEAVLRQVLADLGDETALALIGGLAVSARAVPRTTLDIDVAVASEGDRESELLIRRLVGRGYRQLDEGLVENLATGRLAAVRLVPPGERAGGVVVDLMFDSSGIEPEVVAAASEVEILPGLRMRTATLGHLIALKLLAGRAQDIADARSLMTSSFAADIDAARAAVALIERRGCQRGKDLQGLLGKLIRKEPIETVG